jgi:hypothetical protein
MSEENGNKDLVEMTQETHVVVNQKRFEVARENVPYEEMWSRAKTLSESTLLPVMYQKRPENVLILLETASRMGISWLMLASNLFVIQGKPSLSGQFIGALLRSTPSLRNVQLHYVGTEGADNYGAYVTAERVSTGEILKGATVTIKTAKAEGWTTKTGSKWITMPTLMLSYRAHTWFGRQYTPELLMGLQSSDEIEDVNRDEIVVIDPFKDGE